MTTELEKLNLAHPVHEMFCSDAYPFNVGTNPAYSHAWCPRCMGIAQLAESQLHNLTNSERRTEKEKLKAALMSVRLWLCANLITDKRMVATIDKVLHGETK